ncbi:MAG: hypothetical protein ACJAYC_000500 [Halieaceae bacterium]|jgi:hypothetical protein
MLNFLTTIQITAFIILTLIISGCAGDKPRKVQPIPFDDVNMVDFAGNWELDYSKSENIQTRLNAMVRELRRRAERRSQNGGNERAGGSIAVGNNNTGASVMGLAQMADLITQAQLLEIDQSENDIRVKREENFALTCEFFEGKQQVVENSLGTETCGWVGHQLLFRILLPEGLSIQHVLTRSPEGGQMSIATTVLSDRVSTPFTLNRVYRKFESGESGFTCEVTLTKGRVCTTEAK